MLDAARGQLAQLLQRAALVALAIAFVGLRAACAESAPEYRYDAWTVTNGLPQNIVRGIVQTPDGYLWIATLDGLARFDGVRFTVFNKSNTPGIASNRFAAMVPGADGDLWLVSENGGLTRYHHGAFHTYGPEDGVPANGIRSITADEAGHVWVLSEDSLMQWSDTEHALVDAAPVDEHIHFNPMHWSDGGFWGTDGLLLHTFHAGVFKHYALPDGFSPASLWQVGLNLDGSLWIESADGHTAVSPPGSQSFRALKAGEESSTYRDPHGHLWTLRVTSHLQRFLDFQSSGQPESVFFSRILEDREGNLWVGTEGAGLYRLQRQSIDVFSHAEGLLDSNIYPVLEDHTGAIWVGAWNNTLSRIAGGKVTNYTPAQGLPGPLVTALAEDREGNIWVGTADGIALFKDGVFHPSPPLFLPNHTLPQAIVQDRGGTFWIGTGAGLIVYRDGPSRTLTVQDGLATNDIRVILEDRAGDMWIGGYGGLTRIHGGVFTRWTERDGLPSNSIRALYEDAAGTLWIGTYDGGLGRFKDGKFTRYTEKDGLFNNGVFQILEDDRGNFWMSSNRGIYRVSKQELNAFAAGTLGTITSVAYGRSDGMLNVECNGGMAPAGVKSRDGRLWFPTQDGVAVIDPRTIRINPQPPPVLIESALVDGVQASTSGLLTIPPGRENLQIEYTALSFIHSEQIRFQYKLEGLDSGWIDAGSRRTAYYSHLPSGTYRFRVIARNSDGVWNEVGQSLSIKVLAPFYSTWWFLLILAAVIALLIAFAVRYRLKQLEQKQAQQKAFSQQLIASQENERQRIAAELHDSLGQRLVVINNLALFAVRSEEKGRPPDPGTMQEITAETALAIQETREISYNLRPFQLDRLGLTKAVEGIVRSVSTASGIAFTSNIDNIDDAFPLDLRINFYRIVQESLNNMMKHAQATEASVRVTRDARRVVLTIRDNGRGFDPATRPVKGGKSGFGMTGMAERANSLGGTFQVASAPGQGTLMTAEFPMGDGGRV